MLSLFLEERKKYVYFTLLITTIVTLMNIQKMLYKENRPQWERDGLSTHNELKCSMEYGNPSGHSMIASTLAFALVFDHMETNKNRTRNVRIAYAIAHTCAAVLYAFVMGISRVIVAAHSWNQVIYGWLMGLWIAAFMQLMVRPSINAQMGILLDAQYHTCTRFCSSIVSTFFLMALGIGSQVGAYYLATLYGVQMNDADDDDPILRMGSFLCKEFNKKVAFNNHSLI